METALLALVIYLGGMWTGVTLEQNHQMKQDVVVAKVQEAAQQAAAQEIAKIESTSQTIVQPVREVIHSEVRYRECKHDAATVDLINEALTGKKQGGAK